MFTIYFNIFKLQTCQETNITNSEIKSLTTTLRGQLSWMSVKLKIGRSGVQSTFTVRKIEYLSGLYIGSLFNHNYILLPYVEFMNYTEVENRCKQGCMILSIYFNFFKGQTCQETDITNFDINSLITTLRGQFSWESIRLKM